MSDDKLNLELGVQVTSQGTEKLTDLEKILARIKASQDRYTQSLGKGGNQQVNAAKAALDLDKERWRVTRMAMGERARELRNTQREELRGIKEAERAQAQADRRALASARELTRERDRATRSVGRGLAQAGGGAKKMAGVAAVGTAAAAAITKRATDTITRAGVTIDDALTQAAIHVYGEQDSATSRKSALDLRKRLMPLSSKLGTKTADLMSAYVEAAQAGISDDLLSTAVEQGTKYSRMNKLNVSDVLEQSGYAIQGLKSFGKVTEDTLKAYFDETSYIIATTSANRQELLAATKTGMAAGASVGMDRRQTLAVLGSIVGVGGEGGQASRMLSTQGSRVANWRNKGRDIVSKHHRTAEDRQFLDAVNILGYRDSDSMADAFSKDFFGSLVDAQSKIKGISDPLKRKSITAQLFGKEFGALLDSVIMGGQLKEYRDKLDHASGFLNHNWQKFTGNLSFILDKIGVVLGNVTESMGLALRPLWQEVSQWVDRFKGFDRAGEAVTNFTNGLLSGFGASSVTELLNKIVGDPAKFTLDMRSIFLAGKGFAEGVSAVASGVKSLFSAFAGKDADAQAIGKLTGEIIALGGALTILAPALVTLSALTGIIRGLAAAAGGAASLVGGGTAAGTAAGAAGGGVATAAAGGIFATLKRFIPAFAMPLTMDASKGDRDKLTKRLGDWADKQSGKESHWVDPPHKKAIEANTKAIKDNTRSTEDAAKAAAETKAKDLAAAETKRLNELVAIRNPAMTGTVGGGSSTMDELRQRGFLPSTPNSTPNGATGMPTADAGGARTGGSRSWRNKNPGNLKDGPFARRMGATGRDAAGFAVFPDENTGRKAQEALLFDSERYKGLSIRDAIARYAPGSDGNNPVSYAARMAQAAGVGIDTPLSALTPEQRSRFLDAQRDHEGWKPGVSSGGGGQVAGRSVGSGQSVGHIDGSISMEGQSYRFGSGGHRGANSIPVGSHEITPGAIGPWGQRHGAIGLAGNAIWDSTLNRMRTGVEMHQASSARMLSAGCIAVAKEQWAAFRSHVLDMVKRTGHAYLNVGADGRASITANPQDPTRQAQGGASANPASAPGPLSMPVPPQRPQDITRNVPQGGGRSRPGSAGGGPVTVHIGSIHGGDAKAIGDEVGRRTREAVNGATHDVDPGGFA